jgi:hypothetical protein
MHDSTEPTQAQHLTAARFEENDLLKFQLAVAHLGMVRQEIENLELKAIAAQQRHEQSKADLNRINQALKQKYGLVEGVDEINFASGEIKRGGGGNSEAR